MRGLLLDIVALTGFGAFVYGVHLVYPPAAFIVGGLTATAAAVLSARSR